MAKLVAALCPDNHASSNYGTGTTNEESRPLTRSYSLIVPACDLDTILLWEASPNDLNFSIEKLHQRAHPSVIKSFKRSMPNQYFSSVTRLHEGDDHGTRAKSLTDLYLKTSLVNEALSKTKDL
ncbi:2OG-Fe(II) oxygenase superfamily protein [Metarhizium robertsii ARSEF 23]|uniref:2OG-Fe(II) oxygenase superfamily protein n=1 Tax=Metarhizium robertsii (strain ARSEF 23 / ATCC MYA-3075) TaxID=655844 RepID=A0A0B2X8T2_METRA|nr:2OG-Fe(II) oxygenase superfamily protein [Metarhizium robertsii ARSEF 23]KHO11293.1 2OG-Fe(II) oxygenase superfamily protein [Metarhizium robertsii ARSEF 23]